MRCVADSPPDRTIAAHKDVPPAVESSPPVTLTEVTVGAMYATVDAVKGSDGLPPVESVYAKPEPTPSTAGHVT